MNKLKSYPVALAATIAIVAPASAFIDHPFLVVPAQAIVAQHIVSFREFPPRQRPCSFSVEEALETLRLPPSTN